MILLINLVLAHRRDSRQAGHRAVKTDVSKKLCPGSEVYKRDYEGLIDEFLIEIAYKPPSSVTFNHQLKSRVEKRLMHDISAETMVQFQPFINAAIGITCCTYSFLSMDIQEAIALYTSYAITIKNYTDELSEELQNYATTLTLGQPQMHELLRGFTKLLSKQGQLFGRFAGGMIIKSAIDFMAVGKIEKDHCDTSRLSCNAPDYLWFSRDKSAMPETYSFFLYPEDRYPENRDLDRYINSIPSLVNFLNHTNDLFAFYKEELKPRDTPNRIHRQAKRLYLTPYQSLMFTKALAVTGIENLRKIFANEPDILQDVESHIRGYIFYHLASERYRLAELNLPDATDANKQFYEGFQEN